MINLITKRLLLSPKQKYQTLVAKLLTQLPKTIVKSPDITPKKLVKQSKLIIFLLLYQLNFNLVLFGSSAPINK